MLPTASPFARRGYRFAFLIGVIVILLDQFTKHLAMTRIPLTDPVSVIPGLFNLVNIRNRGAAFGFLNRSDIDWQIWLFAGATALAVGAILMLIRTWPRYSPALYTGLGLVLGGALGNLIDRIRFRAVVDFLDFYIGDWHWPAFNVADIAICVGAMLACLLLWRAPTSHPSSGRKSS
ncbi:MAG TPA: signal peptidase II [Candidatus Avidesulfovibrio excrementigallinarum]|nr:signal peptidase II [Candidatus Avidesulfovibrio excrementigallinarum]